MDAGRPQPGFRIGKVTAFVVVDENDDAEGIIAFMDSTGLWHPMIGADEDRIRSLRPVAEDLARRSGARELKLVQFDNRTVVETIKIEGEDGPDG